MANYTITIIKSTSGASLQPLILGVGATTDFNRMAFSSCPFLLEVRMPHSFANYSNIAILCQTKPTVQRMTIITRIGWLGASDMLLFIILILILVLDSSNWCTCGGFRTWGGAQGSLCPQDPDPKSFHRTIWPNLRSFSSAPNFGVGATTDFNRMAISSCPFLLEVRMPHSLTNYRNIAILCQTKPTVQRMTYYLAGSVW